MNEVVYLTELYPEGNAAGKTLLGIFSEEEVAKDRLSAEFGKTANSVFWGSIKTCWTERPKGIFLITWDGRLTLGRIRPIHINTSVGRSLSL